MVSMRRNPATPRAAVLAAVVALVVIAVACGRGHDEPNSLVDHAGYHVRDDVVYYLNPFPGKAFRIDAADGSTLEIFDRTYARDHERVFINGQLLQGAHAETFRLLERPGFSRDRDRVYQHDRAISADPDNFELLADEMARDRTAVYWSDGSVLSGDPSNFVIISDTDGYLYAKDSAAVFVNGKVIVGAAPATFRVLDGAYSRDDQRAFYFDEQVAGAEVAGFAPVQGPYAVDNDRVYWMGKTIDGADPDTFEVLNANFECSADSNRAYYRQTVIPGADPATFPAGRPVIGCSASSISFGD